MTLARPNLFKLLAVAATFVAALGAFSLITRSGDGAARSRVAASDADLPRPGAATDQRIRGYKERKAALREQVATAGRDALMVFAADKVSKVRELNLEDARSCEQLARGSSQPDRRIAHYRQCLQLLKKLLTDSLLVAELRTELERAARHRRLPAA